MTPTTPAAPPAKPTYEEFLDSVDEDTRAEWVNGETVASSPVSRAHQRLGRFLVKAVSEFVESNGSGEVFYESFQVKTGPDLPGREPDLLFVATENLSRVRQNFLEGPGDLVVEIISPESFARPGREVRRVRARRRARILAPGPDPPPGRVLPAR